MLKVIGKGAGSRPVNLLFVEMIISLLFFIISGAVILRVFVAADSAARRGRAEENMALCAQSIAEAYSVSADAEYAIECALGSDCGFERLDDGKYVVRLDPQCRPTKLDAKITLLVSRTEENTAAGELSELIMEFSSEEDVLYTLKCAAYVPEKGGVYE